MVNGKYERAKAFSDGISDCDLGGVGGRVGVMSFLRLVYRILLGSVALGWAVGLSAALPERKTFQFGEFTIEASAGDEAYVEALAKQLADYRLPEVAPPPPPRLTPADLGKRKEYFLGKICAYLGLAEPTKQMKSAFEGTLKAYEAIGYVAAPPGLPRHFAIWRKPELLARLKAGESIQNFTKGADGMVNFTFKFNLDFKPELTKEQNESALAAEWQKFAMPVVIAVTPDRTPEQEATAALEGCQHFNTKIMELRSSQMWRTSVFIALHEATESGIVWHYLVSKDRRWFCDGIANYVAWKVIEAEFGPEEARGYYDLSAELKKYANEAATIDLAAWPAAENQKQANYAENLNTANYAFATKVIADVCSKHGDAILPRLFAEIGKTPYERATMDTVYRAFKKLTREDLRSYLPKPAGKR